MQSKNNAFDRTRNCENSIFAKLGAHKKRLISAAVSLTAVAAVFVIWHLVAKRIDIPFILPTPYRAFARFFELLPTKDFLSAVAGSMINVISGYLIGVALGGLLAFSAFVCYPVKAVLAPFVKVARSAPVASFILLCILWMSDSVASAFIAFLMVFPIVYENVLTGFNKTDENLIEMANTYGLGRFKMLSSLYLPSALPYLGSAAVTSLGLAWKACVAAEVLCIAEDTIGHYIFYSKDFFDTEQLFAWTIAVIIMSVLLEYAVKGIAYLVKRQFGRSYGK